MSRLAVCHSTSRSALVLGITIEGGREEEEIDLVLSTPAAAQLARMLKKAVKAYLLGDEKNVVST